MELRYIDVPMTTILIPPVHLIHHKKSIMYVTFVNYTIDFNCRTFWFSLMNL